MVDKPPVAANTSSSTATAHSQKVSQFDDPPSLQNRPGVPRFPAGPNQSVPRPEARRRSSTFSDYSLKDARNAFQSSTEDLLLPRPNAMRYQDSSPWHSAPLIFALLPALAGILFTNGSGIVTDIMLLGLAAIFLNWTVRLPWDWYHAAQATRQADDSIHDTEVIEDKENDVTTIREVLDEDKENDVTTIRKVLDEDEVLRKDTFYSKPIQQHPEQKKAASQLLRYESTALLSCFLLPLLGAYLLHSLRSQLNRPSDGLVSNYNLTIFLMASELRPIAHIIKLVQARTIHLQRIVSSKPDGKDLTIELVKEFSQRLEELEARYIINEKPSGAKLSEKQSNLVAVEVRKNIQSDIDVLNRAVRRYEKRATLQAIQTESRFQEVESRLNDAFSLDTAAAKNERRRRGTAFTIFEQAAIAFTIPFRILGAIMGLPLGLLLASIEVGKSWALSRPSPIEKARRPLNVRSHSTTRSKHWPLSQGRGSIKTYD